MMLDEARSALNACVDSFEYVGLVADRDDYTVLGAVLRAARAAAGRSAGEDAAPEHVGAASLGLLKVLEATGENETTHPRFLAIAARWSGRLPKGVSKEDYAAQLADNRRTYRDLDAIDSSDPSFTLWCAVDRLNRKGVE